jgi:nucleoside-diphosphate-sugar epimerase
MLHLVSGGAGFIGAHLVNALVDAGDEVIILDDLTTGRVRNLEHSICTGRATFVYAKGPVGAEALDALIRGDDRRRLARIYHFTTPAGATAASSNWPAAHAAALIELARDHGARFVFASPREGDAQMNPARRKYEELVRDAEAATAEAARAGIVDARIVRLFDCYGAFMEASDGRLVPELIRAILDKTPMRLGADGSRTYALTYVEDAISLLRTVVEWPAAEFAPVEIGSDRETSLEEIASTLARISGVPLKAAFGSEQAAGIVRRRADPSFAKGYGWIPVTRLEDGLRATYRWFGKDRLAYA